MKIEIVGGCRDGDFHNCSCVDECTCEKWGHGAPGGNKIMDGYVEYQMYKKQDGKWVPSHIQRRTMIYKNGCPKCDRAMPSGTEICLNCGADMKNIFETSQE